MVNTNFRFVLEYLAADGQPRGQLPLGDVWQPAIECAEFSVLRKHPGNGGAPAAPARLVATVEPIPQPSAGLPHCSGFKLLLALNDVPASEYRFPATYFRSCAKSRSAELVARGQLKEGELFSTRLLAYAGVAAPVPPAARPRFSIEEAVQPLPLRDTALATFRNRARPFGELNPADVPVFIPQPVIEEAESLAVAAATVETGGILVGYLHRDVSAPDIGLEISAQIPARHAEGRLMGLTFTPETWAAVEAAKALQKKHDLAYLGWWHSHPASAWCSPQCPPERRKECPLTRNFFSSEDVKLHETIFPKAYSVALVVTLTDEGPKVALFGWRDGTIQQRGFEILDNTRPFAPAEPLSALGATHHEKICT